MKPSRRLKPKEISVLHDNVHVGPARNFNPVFHVPDIQNNYPLGNFYGLTDVEHWPPDIPRGQEKIWQANPFYQFRRAYGNDYKRKIWEYGYSSPYQPDDIIFEKFLGAGVCTGMSAVIGYNYENYRMGRAAKDRIKHEKVLNVMYRILKAHMSVLSNKIILHCKYYQCRGPASCFPDFGLHFSSYYRVRPVVMFVPVFHLGDREFENKLSSSHSVFAHSGSCNNSRVHLNVWDCNFPGEASRKFIMYKDGGFRYHTRFTLPCEITSYNERSEWEYVDGVRVPTKLTNMMAIPIDCLQFLTNRLPYMDFSTLIFG